MKIVLVMMACLPFCALPAEEGKREECHGYIFDAYPTVYSSASVHQLAGVSAFGDAMELEDGSVWKISRYDGCAALNWHANDPVIITQNHRWFSHYTYRLVNQYTGVSLEANLFLGPRSNSQYTWYISAIDPVEGVLLLTNSFGEHIFWEISWHDGSIFQNWAVNDAVIIGQNSGWDSRSESLLINVNMDQFARAKQK